MSSTKSGDQFLQRSCEKSRQCLGTLPSPKSFYGKSASKPNFSNTPKQNSSKRGPGFLPYPTIKRARIIGGISYSMKMNKPQSKDTSRQLALEGFSNLGNTCYMNAILQALFGLETFSTDLIYNRKVLKVLQKQSLYAALLKLLYVKRQSNVSDDSRIEALLLVKSAISTTAKRFCGFGQHDAHEFLGQVLDQLKEEVVKVTKGTPTPNKENEGGAENRTETATPSNGNNPISANFEFEVLHTLTCLQCGEQVTNTEQFHDISLEVPKRKDFKTPSSLQDALSLFFKTEEIVYTCEKCGHQKSSVSHVITRLPRVIILHLKRYSFNQVYSKNAKMGQNVSVPFYLTMQNHCTEETQPAFPPDFTDPSHCDSKINGSIFDDSKDDLPSKRKLEYTGFQFKNKTQPAEGDSKVRDSENPFTEAKGKEKDGESEITPEDDNEQDLKASIQNSLKEYKEQVQQKDEVDSGLTMEDEVDEELNNAIQISQKEYEAKTQRTRDFGEDTEGNLQTVLNLSRQAPQPGISLDFVEDTEGNFQRVLKLSREDPTPVVVKFKKVHQLTEEEMIAMVVERSLLDNDPNILSNAHSDEVFENSNEEYMRNNDISREDHSYTESYDIGPDGDHSERFASKSHKTYTRHRQNSELCSRQRHNSERGFYTEPETAFLSEYSELEETLSKAEGEEETEEDCMNCSVNNARSEEKEESDAENYVTKCYKVKADGTLGRDEKSPWRERLHNLSRTLPDSCENQDDQAVSDDLLCHETIPEVFDFESDGMDFHPKCPGRMYELHDISHKVDVNGKLEGENVSDLFEDIKPTRPEKKVVVKFKKVHQLTEEEMIAMVVERSLLDNDPNILSNAHSDEVFENSNEEYMRNNDISREDHSYTESYDIGPDGDHSERFASKSHKTYTRHIQNSELCSRQRHNSERGFYTEPETAFLSEYSELEETLSKAEGEEETEEDCMNCSVNNARSEEKEESDAENYVTKCYKVKADGTLGRDEKSPWRERLHNLSRTLPDGCENQDDQAVSDDLLCYETIPEVFDFESDGMDFHPKCPGRMYELHDISHKVDVNGKLEGEYVSDLFEDIKPTRPEKKGDDSRRSELPVNDDVDDFMFDTTDDDCWLATAEDKENELPFTEKPTLSDPSEFPTDDVERSRDEVDAYLEENVEIPDINNEEGELPYSYRLVSIVNHIGVSSAAGHYLSDVYDMKKKAWFIYDDSYVSRVDEVAVKTNREKSGYIFFYMSKEIFDDLALQHAEQPGKRPNLD